MEAIKGLFDRLFDPGFSRFLSFFISWNWKGCVHLISGKNPAARIEGFERDLTSSIFLSPMAEGYCQDILTVFNNAFLAPAALTFAWMWWWPKLGEVLANKAECNKKNRKEIEQKSIAFFTQQAKDFQEREESYRKLICDVAFLHTKLGRQAKVNKDQITAYRTQTSLDRNSKSTHTIVDDMMEIKFPGWKGSKS